MSDKNLIAAASDLRDCCAAFAVFAVDGKAILRISGKTVCTHPIETPEGQALLYVGRLRRAAVAKAEGK